MDFDEFNRKYLKEKPALVKKFTAETEKLIAFLFEEEKPFYGSDYEYFQIDKRRYVSYDFKAMH